MDTDSEEIQYEYTFTRRTYLIGYPKAVLYMACPDHDDLDVFVQLRKSDVAGNMLQNINIPVKDLGIPASEVETVNCMKYLGPSGILRASHRQCSLELSKPHWSVHAHDRADLIPPGQVVELEIGLWSTGMVFEVGEKLIFKIAGHHMTLAEFASLRGEFRADNKGRHQIYSGPQNPSRLIIPVVHI